MYIGLTFCEGEALKPRRSHQQCPEPCNKPREYALQVLPEESTYLNRRYIGVLCEAHLWSGLYILRIRALGHSLSTIMGLGTWTHLDQQPQVEKSRVKAGRVYIYIVDSKKLAYGSGTILAAFPSSLSFGVGGQSYSNFLASTVYSLGPTLRFGRTSGALGARGFGFGDLPKDRVARVSICRNAIMLLGRYLIFGYLDF